MSNPTLDFLVERNHPLFFTIRITVPPALIEQLYREVSLSQQEHASVHGFIKGKTPLSYVTTAYKASLLEHLKEFLYQHSVMAALYKMLREQKIAIAGEPKLISAQMSTTDGGVFVFECTSPQDLLLHDWRFYTFKPPKRKNYRDLDRQVEFFIQGEEENRTKYQTLTVQPHDWVCFETWVADKTDKRQLSLPQTWWLKIGNEEIDAAFAELFLGKHKHDTFYTNVRCMQELFSSKIDSQYLFGVTVTDIIPDAVFSLDDFKTTFKLRTNKDMHKKLIEVFSFRNDLSQRRETVEDVFKLFLMQHPVEVPKHVVLRRQEQLMHAMQENPDFHVYRVQRDFHDKIRMLAEKQIRQAIIIDQLAIRENLAVDHDDVKQYLNLLKRPRTKEFVYFTPPPTRINGKETPIAAEQLKRSCLREKALNHIIYHLTKN